MLEVGGLGGCWRVGEGGGGGGAGGCRLKCPRCKVGEWIRGGVPALCYLDSYGPRPRRIKFF